MGDFFYTDARPLIFQVFSLIFKPISSCLRLKPKALNTGGLIILPFLAIKVFQFLSQIEFGKLFDEPLNFREEVVELRQGFSILAMGGEQETSLLSMSKTSTEISRPSSMVVKKAHTMIPAHIVAEAISTLHGLDLRWSGPITPAEMQYVEQYVLAKYPQYARLEGEKIDLSCLCINEEASEPAMADDRRKSPRGTTRESPTPSFGSNLPYLDGTQLEPSRLLDILTQKSSFPGSFISIPECQARNKVLKHCGLPDEEYLVLFTPTYKDAMMLVGESYPFMRGNYYMSSIREEDDYIKEFASYKESKVIPAPESWLDLRIKGSQLSQNFRRKSKLCPKGLFSYPADINGTRYSLHWISEARRNSWHVLLDATAFVGDDRLNLQLHRPDFLLCSLDNTHANPSRIICVLVRKKSFDTSTTMAGNQTHGKEM